MVSRFQVGDRRATESYERSERLRTEPSLFPGCPDPGSKLGAEALDSGVVQHDANVAIGVTLSTKQTVYTANRVVGTAWLTGAGDLR